jgi:hypothetical protein
MNHLKAKEIAQFPTAGDAKSLAPATTSAAAPIDFPPSISRDDPERLDPEARSHKFFVRTKRPGLLSNIGVIDLLGECPRTPDGEGVVIHRDVLFSLAYDLLDRVHELAETRKAPAAGASPYDPRVAELCDKLGSRDAEIKELRAALGEAAIKIRRHEQKLFK